MALRIKVLTLNLWGYNGDWQQRRALIAELLRKECPDVVGLQEACDWRQFNAGGDHQVRQLARLAGYPFAHFQPAYRRPDKALGQGILSQHPIVAVTCLLFPRDPTDPKDTEDRVAVWGQVAMPDGIADIVVTHLSLSLKARERSVRQLADWLWRQSGAPKILMGDFNDVPDSRTLQFLLSATNPPFTDAWALAHPDEQGFTFPSHAPQHRIDYVLFAPPNAFTVCDIYLVGKIPNEAGIFLSDHLGIVAVLDAADL